VDITLAPMDRQETLSRLSGGAEKGIRISLKQEARIGHGDQAGDPVLQPA
jgi:hypothetical protein